MNKLRLFLLAMAIYYIFVIFVVSKLVIFPIIKVLMLVFFIGAGFIFTRRMRKKLQ
ncbi:MULTISPECIES: hypothetical protein [unclassified Lysinibacillus]|uniref:hypothetical protein n=1 Tax=unclassified Lysinibacillus TaxID=2636778 RepID=UPI00155EB264|nr:hypothetical protein [Lysinibacillus sp. CD3-6]QPQ36024.1 hypothetical protein JNUCC52_03595 [Lysinibacillus sp. JNUCC-52]UED82320.1 hypothetical protein FH508_0010605 [Lysinibacillus sp. CD3-6]